jgi:hypothetical protein
MLPDSSDTFKFRIDCMAIIQGAYTESRTLAHVEPFLASCRSITSKFWSTWPREEGYLLACVWARSEGVKMKPCEDTSLFGIFLRSRDVESCSP